MSDRPLSDRRRLGALSTNPELDRWIDLSIPGRVVISTGKVELGQGIRSALVAIAADELCVAPERVVVAPTITGRSPNEWVTAGSGSIEQSGTAMKQACAHARHLLLARAAARLGTTAEKLSVDDGTISAPDGTTVTYWELVDTGGFGVKVEEPSDLLPLEQRRWIGRGIPRIDLPAKVAGEAAFVHDLHLPDMRHARVVRAPRPGAVLSSEVPVGVGNADVVRNGNFVAVVADREADAVSAASELQNALAWSLPTNDRAPDWGDWQQANVAESVLIVDGAAVDDAPSPPLQLAGRTHEATYTKPFILHASIGPSAAVAYLDGSRLRVWSHSQGVEMLRFSIAEVVAIAGDDIEVTHVDGAGCYGHNGADDAALDAALVAVAQPGRPICLKWTRADEHRWEPVSSAMSMSLGAELDAEGCIAAWQHDVLTYAHGARPRAGRPGFSGLLASWDLERAFERATRRSASRGFHSGGHRNADPIYDIPRKRIVKHFLADPPFRTSSTRGLGAFGNVFALESFMDELAQLAGRDPVEFRLAHLSDQRGRAVIEAAVELAGGLRDTESDDDAVGRGLAFARYENVKAYCAIVVQVRVEARTGGVALQRAWIACDAGEVIDPDGLVNQLEGGFVQAASWALKEELTVDDDGARPADWDGYPILRFSDVPEVSTTLLDQPGLPSLGAGEASTGPTPAAIANAIAAATGVRIRDLPLRPERVKDALWTALSEAEPPR